MRSTLCLFCVTAIASAAYEQACVLFSIAAMQTQVANAQDMKTDDGLKMAAKLFQVSVKCSGSAAFDVGLVHCYFVQ